MKMKLEVWNRHVANGDIRVVGKKFFSKGMWYVYVLGKKYVEVAHDI